VEEKAPERKRRSHIFLLLFSEVFFCFTQEKTACEVEAEAGESTTKYPFHAPFPPRTPPSRRGGKKRLEEGVYG
jgi:hypothetical protein